MAISAGPFILGPSYRSANDLARNLATLFTSGIGIDAINTAQVDARYARLAGENSFTRANVFRGAVTVQDVTGENALDVRHGADGTGDDVFGVRIVSSGGAGALWCRRDIPSADVDESLVRISEGASAVQGVRIDYGGSSNALQVNHSGSGGYGLEVSGRGINVSGTSLFANAVTVSGLLSASGGLTVASGLTVTSGGAAITGNLAVTGAISSGGTSVVLVSSTYSLSYVHPTLGNQTKTIYAPP